MLDLIVMFEGHWLFRSPMGVRKHR